MLTLRGLLLVAVVALCAGSALASVQIIQLGSSLTLTQNPPTARMFAGQRTRDGMLLFLERQHDEPLVINNTTYIFNITFLDDEGANYFSLPKRLISDMLPVIGNFGVGGGFCCLAPL